MRIVVELPWGTLFDLEKFYRLRLYEVSADAAYVLADSFERTDVIACFLGTKHADGKTALCASDAARDWLTEIAGALSNEQAFVNPTGCLPAYPSKEVLVACKLFGDEVPGNVQVEEVDDAG